MPELSSPAPLSWSEGRRGSTEMENPKRPRLPGGAELMVVFRTQPGTCILHSFLLFVAQSCVFVFGFVFCCAFVLDRFYLCWVWWVWVGPWWVWVGP